MKKKLTVQEAGRLGGLKRAQLPKEKLSEIGKKGGRPKKQIISPSSRETWTEEQRREAYEQDSD